MRPSGRSQEDRRATSQAPAVLLAQRPVGQSRCAKCAGRRGLGADCAAGIEQGLSVSWKSSTVTVSMS